MPEPTNPSSGTGATPGTGTPATGTPASGATPPAAALTLEDALKKIAELEQHASNKTEEAARHGTKLTAAEKELAAYKAAEQAARDAQLSEAEKLNKALADAQEEKEALAAELFKSRVFEDVTRLANKFNFIVSADTLARLLLLDDDAIEFEDGKPTNVEKLLDKLAKAEPSLVKPEQQQQQQRQGAPATPAMNPGRSSIAQPGGNMPGKIPRLEDLEWKR